jgi:hypothetical protein
LGFISQLCSLCCFGDTTAAGDDGFLLIITITILFIVAAIMDLGKRVAG